MLRPDGPFIAVPVLTAAFPQYLDQVPGDKLDKLRIAWAEVQESRDTLTPAWTELVLTELLGYNAQVFTEGAGLPTDLASGPGIRPDAAVYGPGMPADAGGSGDRVARLLVYRRPFDEELTKATRDQLSPAEQAATLCRDRAVPLALLTNGAHWVLVHSPGPGEPVTTVVFDADYWLEVRDLLHAFYSLLRAPFLAAGKLAELFSKSAAAQAEVTSTLGDQVARAVELLVAEASRLDRESGGTLLAAVEPKHVYRGALSVMMRLVFLLYAEELELLPMKSDLYVNSYSVSKLYDHLQEDRDQNGDQVVGRRAAAWARLLATFGAIHGGCEHDEMRILPYGGGMFDPARYPWLEKVAVSDLVTAEALRALLFLRRPGKGPERLSYKGLDVEQIGHVYEGLLEFGCERAAEPYLGLIGKLDRQVPLSAIKKTQEAAEKSGDRAAFRAWLKDQSGATPAQVQKALDQPKADRGTLDAACDNDTELAERIWPFRGLLRLDLRDRPTVFPAGSLFITHDGDRRATGTHYTPRKLAEKIVRYTLEPLCYSPGPADGVPAAEGNVLPAAELIKLRVLDPAMGSGAFLVSACRYLADRLISAWTRDGYPEQVRDVLGADFDRADAHREACRWVAARCLYGVDRDEAAVELGKLSLWLTTLAKDKPFSFLDHALRWGDSLVGLTSADQLHRFHLDPVRGQQIAGRLHGYNNRLHAWIDDEINEVMAEVKQLRREIASKPVADAESGAEMTAKLERANAKSAKLRTAADAVAAAALSTAGRPAAEFDDRLTALSSDVQRFLDDDNPESPLERALRDQLQPWLKGERKDPVRPFHWPLEFPEVMDAGGFSAVVSNPPFMGGQTLRERIGTDFREYMVNHIGGGTRGSADLCSYFLLRNLSIAQRGRVGIIATNTIAQGDTREVGLDRAVADLNWTIYRAIKSQPWEGTASLEVSLLWLGHAGAREQRVLDDVEVIDVTSSLNPQSRVSGKPDRLKANKDKAFQGSNILGQGFILKPEEAQAMIRANEKNKEVLFPYLNGEDLNSEPDSSATRWVINFRNMDLLEATHYHLPYDRVLAKVKPFRAQNKDPKRRKIWWQFTRPTVELYETIANLDRVLVIAQTSRTQMPTLVLRGQVFDQKLVVFPTSSTADLAFRTSAFQYWWTVRNSSSMKTDTVYAPSDCCETLPCPEITERLTAAGDALDAFRPDVMTNMNTGLTKLYDIVGDEADVSPDIERLREIHVEIDEAVREAYALDEEREPEIREFEAGIASDPLPSWREIDLAHGFHPTPQGVRFTISPQARIDLLDKLLALNHYRHQQEQRSGSSTSRTKARSKPKSLRRAAAYPDSSSSAATLFDSPDTLF